MFSVQRERGRLAELAPVVRILAGDAAREGPWRPGLVALLAELGMEAEARRELSRLLDDGLEPFRESLWLASLAYLADAAAALGDEKVAALVYPELEPLAGANVMIGHLVSCYGAADRYLGMLATTLGEWERAEEHFERGMELNRRMGAVTWLAHTANEYARLLLRRPGGDRTRAEALLGEAAGLAERIGMPALLGRIRALGSPASAGAARRPPCFQTASPRARSRSWRLWRRVSATARLARRSRSASTPPPTTCGAFSERRAAPTAQRPRRTRTGTGLCKCDPHLITATDPRYDQPRARLRN